MRPKKVAKCSNDFQTIKINYFVPQKIEKINCTFDRQKKIITMLVNSKITPLTLKAIISNPK